MTDKWGRRLFTAGAVLLLLLGLVHSLSLLEKPIPANDTERQLMDLMAHYRFNLMGSMRSMDNFLRGFSISFMLGVFCVGAIDLVLGRERAGLLRRVALVNAIWLAAMTAIGLRYFFAAPTSFLAIALLIFVGAWLMLPGEEKV
ncbi:MAG: hypothetical protein WCB05_11850 [Candidatus Sulfotelmatobacter sp.]